MSEDEKQYPYFVSYFYIISEHQHGYGNASIGINHRSLLIDQILLLRDKILEENRAFKKVIIQNIIPLPIVHTG